MRDDIRKEKILRFLERHGPHFEFHSRSFNYSMSKEGSSEETYWSTLKKWKNLISDPTLDSNFREFYLY